MASRWGEVCIQRANRVTQEGNSVKLFVYNVHRREIIVWTYAYIKDRIGMDEWCTPRRELSGVSLFMTDNNFQRVVIKGPLAEALLTHIKEYYGVQSIEQKEDKADGVVEERQDIGINGMAERGLGAGV
jgi:hypothetical protein